MLICKIKLQLKGYIKLFQQFTSFFTWWAESSIISSGSILTQNMIRETTDVEKKKKKKRWIKIKFFSIPELRAQLKNELYF